MQSGLGFKIEQEHLQTVTETVGGVPPLHSDLRQQSGRATKYFDRVRKL